MRNCEYKNCNKCIDHKDKRAKFCDRKCKGYARKYRQRDRERLERYTEYNQKMIDDIKLVQEMSPESKNLWKLIYGN
jgi:hypothetical protein